MAWSLLIGAGLLEVVWALALERSAGFTRLWPSLIGITSAAASFTMLALALTRLPLGTAYTVWVGLGAVGVVLVGIVLLGESASATRLLCLGLIVTGVIGLKLT
ncbi:QacE family quaternary ammonium compound efflux SMR transporter [Actinophytocola xinjiangensis]|jgi:quaternary ammonium compound-resistance protein SugE|uniref:QacE family quaternary ammonium compound efflux SMR transporter n=1 Tax=Actinophytocola xinjiangensis TaxID=485602 RepID=A0A7Z0WT49_9PSEU|nr:SMR family transporter [Actinophytocola xinjiangensis]OLF14297.1 QacE family quaternary ammonium compound efflux SMR transporter [Actinophytocola xinjiangensis]